MNTPAVGTRTRILNGGLDLLSGVGLSGVTLGVLAQQVGLSKSGLFAHFQSKEQVQLALLQKAAELAMSHVVKPSKRAAAGLPQLRALVQSWLGWSTKAGLRGGCPIAAALFELDDVEGIIREKVVELESQWRAELTSPVRDAVEQGHLRPNLDIEQFVWELCGIYLSHHASNRFLRDSQADQRALSAFESLLRNAQLNTPGKPPHSTRRSTSRKSAAARPSRRIHS